MHILVEVLASQLEPILYVHILFLLILNDDDGSLYLLYNLLNEVILLFLAKAFDCFSIYRISILS